MSTSTSFRFLFDVAVLVVAIIVAVTIAMVLTGRRQRAREGTYNGQALSFVGGVMNSLFIVSLAFLAVTAWQAASSARQRTFTEAGGLVEIYSLSAQVAEPARTQVQQLVRGYLGEVVDHEWSLMAEGTTSQTAADLLRSLRSEVAALPASPDAAKVARDRSVDRLREVSDARRQRISEVNTGPSLYLLIAVLVNGIVVVSYPMLIGFTAGLRHVIALGLMAAMVGMAIFIAVDLSRPFTGISRVNHDAFDNAIEQVRP